MTLKAKKLDLTPVQAKEIIARLRELLPVTQYGASLQDFLDHQNRMPAGELAEVTRCLYKLYRWADVAAEPRARECDREYLENMS